MSGNPEKVTTDGRPPREGHEAASAPAPINPATGQHEAYWILSHEERAKGFIRPVRVSYRHVGIAGPRYPLRDLTEDERAQFSDLGWTQFEAYPPGEGSAIGRYWKAEELASVGRACHAVTTMNTVIAETYARDPGFYGSTFCATCRTHRPVGRDGEFVWLNSDGSASTERVGT